MSLYSSILLSTCFYCKERLCVEVTDVASTFFLLRAQMTQKMNFPLCEMALLHCLVEIKEIVVSGATSGVLYNCLPKVIITLQGLESYTTCFFQKYGCPKRTSQTSRGEISHNTSSLKGLMSQGRRHYQLTQRSLPWRSQPMVQGCGCSFVNRSKHLMTFVEIMFL